MTEKRHLPFSVENLLKKPGETETDGKSQFSTLLLKPKGPPILALNSNPIQIGLNFASTAFQKQASSILNSQFQNKSSEEQLKTTVNWSDEMSRRFLVEKFANRRIGHPYQSRAQPKNKKPRTAFNKRQINELEDRFCGQKYLASSERAELARQLRMSDSQVKTWFQNRRTKWRRQTAEEKEYERKKNAKLFAEVPYLAKLGINQDPAYMARPDVKL